MSTHTKEAVSCTCPNCGHKFTTDKLGEHMRTCPRKENREFPKYLVTTSVPGSGQRANQNYVTIGEAGRIFDSGFMKVDIGKEVLEPDFSLRPITSEEEALISSLADDHSASK